MEEIVDDHQDCIPKGNAFMEDGLLPPPSVFPAVYDHLYSPDPSSITGGSWERAEEAACLVLWTVQPTAKAGKKRQEVVEYIQGLIRNGLGYEVFPYGSVPLKTYLPDGDIDLTALSSPTIEDTLVSDLHAVLRGEELNENAQYKVRDVHCIDAEVKLVKCLVENIVVDISFNQLGGLCTLCFLEQVNSLVGKGHLFKRSIILIKAWCYYESRILGAHHGLISTYALETLVLYIFHLFHFSLNGPLAALYRFLDYFSKFDWENYCISLNGPVCKSSLPAIVAEDPDNGGNDRLLSEEFIHKCVKMFSVQSKGIVTNSRVFPQKHLNIIDPLKENNNLGRSVNRGNFYRICSAFKYGARKLGQILLLPRERMANELIKFFSNTLQRHGSNHQTRVQNRALASDATVSDRLLLSSRCNVSSGNSTVRKQINANDIGENTSGMQAASRYRNRPEGGSFKMLSSSAVPELRTHVNGNASGDNCHGEAKDFLESRLQTVRSTNDNSGCVALSSNLGNSPSEQSHHASQFNIEGFYKQNGKVEKGNHVRRMTTNSVADDMTPGSKEKHLTDCLLVSSCDNLEGRTTKGLEFSSPTFAMSKNLSCDCREKEFLGTSSSFEPINSLLDLGGDYDSQIWSVIYGKYCHLYAVSAPVLPYSPKSPQSQNNNPLETLRQSILYEKNVYSQMNTNGISGQHAYTVNPPVPSTPALGSEHKKKPQGTGTYIPNVDYYSNRDACLSGSGRFQETGSHGQLLRDTHNNGVATALEVMTMDDGCNVLSLEEYPALGNGKTVPLPTYRPYSSVWGSCSNTSSSAPEEVASRTCGLQARELNRPEGSVGVESCGSDSESPQGEEGSPKEVQQNSGQRAAQQTYQLKDEVDFPPLSV